MVINGYHDASAHSEELAGAIGISRFHCYPHCDATAAAITGQSRREVLVRNSAHAGADGFHAPLPGFLSVKSTDADHSAGAKFIGVPLVEKRVDPNPPRIDD